MTDVAPTNDDIAGVLDRIAELLEVQEANPHRVRAYRNGASSIRSVDRPVAAIVRQEGAEALEVLPGIGEGLSTVIAEYVRTGRSVLLEQLEGEVSPEALFARVPGIGEELAHRVVSALGIHSLEALEEAAHDGRLERVEGFGPGRVRAVQLGLNGLLRRSGARFRREPGERPGVDLLLDLDAEYRREAEAGRLPTITPRRFNPEGAAWLPVMRADRAGWRFTVLYSNTARAHELGKTKDWVVIYYDRDGVEGQATVVTKAQGPLEGRRVVRGRERACRRYYERRHAQGREAFDS